MQDNALLAQYARNGSEAAFSQLLARHLPLVLRTCRRELASDTLAEDAAQVVFLLLARKAGTLRAGPSLAGWLYQTSVFVAKDIRKQEARRTRREEAVMQETRHPQTAPPTEWDAVEPHLNAALSALKPADRDAVLLRFLEGRTLAETGTLLGISEDAARMRVTRALEKLRRTLTAHGAAVTGVVLAALLTAEAARPVPAQAASTVTQGTLQALANSPAPNVLLLSKGVSHTMKIIKIKYAALAAGLLLAGVSVPALVHAFSLHKVNRRQVSQSTPISDPTLSHSTIPGDYTLTYKVQQKALLTPQQRKDPRMKQYLSALQMLQPTTLTLSERDGKFLYQSLSQQNSIASFVLLYDGSNSFEYNFSDHRGDIYTGLYGGDLHFAPIPSTYMVNLPTFKNVRSLGEGEYEGEMFYPNGVQLGTTGTSSYEKTRLHIENISGLLRVTKFETLGDDGTFILPTTVSKFVKFKGVWVPSEMTQTLEGTGQTVWTLVGSKPVAEDPILFDYHFYLHPGEVVQDDMDQRNPRIISYTFGMDIFSQRH